LPRRAQGVRDAWHAHIRIKETQMKRSFWLAALATIAVARPALAQDDIASLKAALTQQQAVIAQLVQRVAELEKKQADTVSKADLEQEAKTEEDAVNSVRETLFGKVNVNGYNNFRYFKDGSEAFNAFQQDHLGVLLAKQMGRFNVFTELELQNVPHHPQVSAEGSANETTTTDISGEGQVAVENAWVQYNHNRYLNVRVGKQLSPQYWWQNHYPNLTYSTDLPIYLRELFPPELVGVMVQGSAATPAGASEFGLVYKFYVANNDFEGNSRTDLQQGKAWGARVQLRFPTAGMLKRFDVAGDVYRGHVSLTGNAADLTVDNVNGFETQIELSRFLLNAEYARGRSTPSTRSGYYVQPAVRLNEDWLAFYRVEQLESARIQRAERRHLAGINYRPFPQIAFKAEYYRAIPLERLFIKSAEERKPFNGFATSAVFFF
jgi:hypothetical protein